MDRWNMALALSRALHGWALRAKNRKQYHARNGMLRRCRWGGSGKLWLACWRVGDVLCTDTCSSQGGVRRILVRGSMPPCRLRRRKVGKFDYEIVHSEVYLNKYVVSIASFSTPACPNCSQNIQKTALFACFRFLIFHPFFQGGGVSWPHLSLCAGADDSSWTASVATATAYTVSSFPRVESRLVHSMNWTELNFSSPSLNRFSVDLPNV